MKTWFVRFSSNERASKRVEEHRWHLVETIVAGQEAISEDELRTRYSGWDISFVQEPGASKTFVARKSLM